MNTPDTPPPSHTHNNADLLVWALYQLGGFDRWVDVEELYLKAFELGPARLSWRTRPDLPDYKKCAKALQEVEDAKKTRHLGLLDKKSQYERRLTPAGKSWCEHYDEVLIALYSGGTVPVTATSDDARRIRTLTTTDAYSEWLETGEMTSDTWELGDTFRCTGDSTAAIWRSRLDEHLLAAERDGRTEIINFIEAARTIIEEKVAD